MPMTEVARAKMMRALLDDDELTVGLGPSEDRESTDSAYQRQPLHFELLTFSNDVELRFPRQADDARESLTTWFLFDGDGRVLAFDGLERPLMPRKGERAKFAAGAIRLGLH